MATVREASAGGDIQINQGGTHVHLYQQSVLVADGQETALLTETSGISSVGHRSLAISTGVIQSSESVRAAAPSQTGAEHDQIDEICKLLESGHAEKAIESLTKMRSRVFGTCEERVKYRILANIGNAHYQRGERAKAASFYFEAYQHQPNDLDSKALKAIAFLATNNLPNALAIAAEILAVNPVHERAWEITLKTTPQTDTYDQVLRRVPPELLGTAGVASTIADVANTRGLHRQAVEHMRSALASSPNSYAMKFWLGMSLLALLNSNAMDAPEGSLREEDDRTATEAIEVFSAVIDRLENAELHNLLGLSYLGRALCHRAKGDESAAESDLEKASQIAPFEPDIALHFSKWQFVLGQKDRAVATLESSFEKSKHPEVGNALSRALAMRDSPGDALRAKTILQDLLTSGAFSGDEAFDLLLPLVHLGATKGDDRTEEERIAALGVSETDDFTQLVLFAHLALVDGNPDRAGQLARSAAAVFAQAGENKTRRMVLADIYQNAKLLNDAIATLLPICAKDRLTYTAFRILTLAQRAGDEGTILQVCETLREAGCIDEEIIQLEFQVLCRYKEHLKAEKALSALLERQPDNQWALIYRSFLGVELDRPEWIINDESRLPAAREVSEKLGNAVVYLLMYRFDRKRAIDYAYTFFRRFPESESAHRTLFGAVFHPGGLQKDLAAVETVAPGTAVTFTEVGGTKEKTIVFEDETEPPPAIDRDEHAIDGPWFLAMKGLGAKARFKSPGASVAPVEYEIKKISPKAIFRANEVPSRWRDRFPERFFVEEFRLPEGYEKAKTPREVLGRVYDVLLAQSKHHDEMLSHFEPGSFPISVISKMTGKKMFDLITSLGSEPNCSIRCCIGTVEERATALDLCKSGSPIVLDSSSVATLSATNRLELPSKLGLPLLIPEAILGEYREIVEECGRASSGGGVLGIVEDRPVFQPLSAKFYEDRKEKADNVIRLGNQCRSFGGTGLIGISPRARQILDKMDEGTSHAIAIAKEKKAILWTDDLAVARFCRAEFGIPSVWTFAVVHHLHFKGDLDLEGIESVAVTLNSLGFRFVPITAGVIVRALEWASWDENQTPAKQALDRFLDPEVNQQGVQELLFGTMRSLWRQSTLGERERLISLAIFARIEKLPNGKAVIQALDRAADLLMGLHVVAAQSLRNTIKFWREGGGGIIKIASL